MNNFLSLILPAAFSGFPPTCSTQDTRTSGTRVSQQQEEQQDRVSQKQKEFKELEMSVNLNDAAMAGNVEEVLIRLNMGEDVNQKCYPR